MNSNNEKWAIIIVILVFICVLLPWAISEKNRKEEPSNSEVSSTTAEETVNNDNSLSRDISLINLKEVNDWENIPYEMNQPEQIITDIETINKEKDSNLEFTYVWDSNIIFKIGYSNFNDTAFFCINDDKKYDLKNWSIFKDGNKVVFITDETKPILKEKYTFVEIDSKGSIIETEKYIDLMGVENIQSDQIFTVPGAEATIVCEEDTISVVRKGKVLSKSTLPKATKNDEPWYISNYLITNDGTLYYILLDKSNWDSVTINYLKVKEGVKENTNRMVYANDEYWNIFITQDNKYVAFCMDNNTWNQSALFKNRYLSDTLLGRKSSVLDYKVKEIALDKPERFELEYDEIEKDYITKTNCWRIKFFYGDEIYTEAEMPGLDENIFMSTEDIEKFNHHSYDVDELEKVRKEMEETCEKYVSAMYENYLK